MFKTDYGLENLSLLGIIKMLPLGHGQCRKFCIALFSVYVVSLSKLIGQIRPLAVLCPNRWPRSTVAKGGSADDVGCAASLASSSALNGCCYTLVTGMHLLET